MPTEVSLLTHLKEVQKNHIGARATDGKPRVSPFDFSPDRKF